MCAEEAEKDLNLGIVLFCFLFLVTNLGKFSDVCVVSSFVFPDAFVADVWNPPGTSACCLFVLAAPVSFQLCSQST